MKCPRNGCRGKVHSEDRQRVPLATGGVERTRVYQCECGTIFHASRFESPWKIDTTKTKAYVRPSSRDRDPSAAHG